MTYDEVTFSLSGKIKQLAAPAHQFYIYDILKK